MVLLSGLLPTGNVWAQRPYLEILDFDRPEAWAMSYFSSALLLTGYGPQDAREKGWLDIGLEVVHIPYLDEDYRRVGFNGGKEENLNNAPVGFRPRLTYYFTPRVSLTASYTPPIELWDVKPNILNGSLNWRALERGPWSVGLRVVAQSGAATGPFTCDAETVAAGLGDFENNPFGCVEVSRDRVHMDYYGGEISTAYRIETMGGLTPFFSVSWNHLRSKFKVDSTLFGQPDRRVEKTEGNTVTYSGGFTFPVGEKLSFGLQAAYTPLDVRRPGKTESENDSIVNVRAQFIWHFGRLWGRGKVSRDG